jgi:predicted GNAT family acetyltransferase
MDRVALAMVRNGVASRFEGRIDGELVAVIDFFVDGTTVVVVHTGTEPPWRGRGIAAALTRFALDDARARGQHVRPLCPFTATFIEEHTPYHDLLA